MTTISDNSTSQNEMIVIRNGSNHTNKKRKNDLVSLLSSSTTTTNLTKKSTDTQPTKNIPKGQKRPKYRQANESIKGNVEILCYTCRRNPSNQIQKSVTSFFMARKPTKSKSNTTTATTTTTASNDNDKEKHTIKEQMIDTNNSNNNNTTPPTNIIDITNENDDDHNDYLEYDSNDKNEDNNNDKNNNTNDPSIPVCSRCRQPLVLPSTNKSILTATSTRINKCPYIKRLEGYKKHSKDHNIPYDIKDSVAIQMMNSNCILCNESPNENGNGLTRLKHWPAYILENFKSLLSKNQTDTPYTVDHPPTKGKLYMGPYCIENVQPACKYCNLMKGSRTIQAYIEACKHIATYRFSKTSTFEMDNQDTIAATTDVSATNSSSPSTKNGMVPINKVNSNAIRNYINDNDINNDDKDVYDFGYYPNRFRNNISKRSRSCYITKSSTHTKTHSLTNEIFNKITNQPCHYCGKKANPPHHYNGLDRLDSDDRVYSIHSVVSCCGDCNIMKYTYSEAFFLNHCLKVAIYNRDKMFPATPTTTSDKSEMYNM